MKYTLIIYLIAFRYMPEDINHIEQRIDKNQDKLLAQDEIFDFLKDENNVKSLWENLSKAFDVTNFQKKTKLSNDIFNAIINNKDLQKCLSNKISNNQQLNKSELLILYIQSLVDWANKLNIASSISIVQTWTDIYSQYWWQQLLSYIRKYYNNPNYNFYQWWIKKTQTLPIFNNTESLSKKIQLPNIDTWVNFFSTREFEKLLSWAQSNFREEVDNEKIASQKRNSEKSSPKEYVKYDLYIFSLKKYQLFIEKEHESIVNSIYWSIDKFEEQTHLAEKYFSQLEEIISSKFPNIEEISIHLQDYVKELSKIKNKYLKWIDEEEANKRYNQYIKEINAMENAEWISHIKQVLSKEPTTSEEAQEYFNTLNKLQEIKWKEDVIKWKYSKTIDNYESYLLAKNNIINEFGVNNLNSWNDQYSKYIDTINKYDEQYKDFNKANYNNYIKQLSNSGLSKHFNNLNKLMNCLKDTENDHFPIRYIKEEIKDQKEKQKNIDEHWNRIKNSNILLYQLYNVGARSINAFISSTWWTWRKLWATLCSLWHDDDETKALFERADNWIPLIGISTVQSQSVYENGKITFNWDNGPWVIAESIVNMYTLIAWSWALAKWAAKWATLTWINVWTKWLKIAQRTWLFSSWFIQQVWPSFQEWLNAWMRWNDALLYSCLSAWIQWALELVSPNEFLLWKWSWVAKQYIHELLKDWSKNSFKVVWKLFLKNVWSEILEENIQESLQLCAWNLVNMWANNQFELWNNALDSDWNLNNFAATILVTTLTTWIVTWWSTIIQGNSLSSTNKSQLIQEIKANPELYSDVIDVLDKAIDWKTNIPGTNIESLTSLKWSLINDSKNLDWQYNEWNIIIPSGNFAAPNEFFAETDESFRNIVTDNIEKIRKLNNIWNIDIFIQESFSFLKEKMDLNPDIQLQITDNDNYYDVKTNTVYISRNWTWVEKKHVQWQWDKSEIFWWLAHELNHYLQRKEFILNLDQDSNYRVKCLNFLENDPNAKANIEYILNNYPDNLDLQQYFEKAQKYWENRSSYVNPEIDYQSYKNQTVEAESFRRWDIISKEFRKATLDYGYFDWKSHKFDITESQARSNSSMMDMVLTEINEQNKSEKLNDLRQKISEQYKQTTWNELNLTDEQLFSILDAHEQDGILWELTIWQLRQKVRVLSETITDSNVKRFLLEAGFCRKVQINNKINIDADRFEVPLKKWKCEYVSIDTGESPETITKEQAKECFFNWLDVAAQLMEWQSQRAVLSSWSLFLNNPAYMKLWWDIDLATDVETFKNIALNKWQDWQTKLEQFFKEKKIVDLKFTLIDHTKISIKESGWELIAEWENKKWGIVTKRVNDLIDMWDIRVEFNIPSKVWLLINCEFFPEPKWYWLIQLWTKRTEWKINTYTINSKEVKTVNEELAAMSYIINLAHEISNNCVRWVQKWKKLKDAVRINNFLQYLSSIWLNTPNDIINFIVETKNDYESQKWKEIIIDWSDGTKTINLSQYLEEWLEQLPNLIEILKKIESQYKTVIKMEADSRGTETTISFNDFIMLETYSIKDKGIKWEIWVNEALIEIEKLKSKINIRDPQNFAYYYEIYQLQKNFIETWFKIQN